jgi:hypothetical protein
MKEKILITVLFIISIFIIGCGTIGEDIILPESGTYSGTLKQPSSIITLEAKINISYFNDETYISLSTSDSKNKNISIYDITLSSDKITGKMVWFDDNILVNGNIIMNFTTDKIEGNFILSDYTQMNFELDKIDDEEKFFVPYFYPINVDGNKNDWTKINSIILNTNSGEPNGSDLKSFGIVQNDTVIFAYIEYYNNPVYNNGDTVLSNTDTKYWITFQKENNEKIDFIFLNNNTTILNNDGLIITDDTGILSVVHNEVIEFAIPKYLIKSEFNISEITQLNLRVRTTREENNNDHLIDSLHINNNIIPLNL